MNIDITGAFFILWIQYDYPQTQCKEGASDVNVNWTTPITFHLFDWYEAYLKGYCVKISYL